MNVLRYIVIMLLLSGSSGCGPSLDEQAAELPQKLYFPAREEFAEVGPALQLRCGTLDCHGHVGRNLRLYGYGGLRFPTLEHPVTDTALDDTTDAELLESYRSIVYLEPDELSEVVAQTARPDTLALIRKGRGTEHHKGGQLMRQLDPLDTCLTRWLTRTHDGASCTAVVDEPRPGEP